MNGYVESGYVVGLGTLVVYAASLVGRERASRRRLSRPELPAGAVPDAERHGQRPEGEE